MTHAFNHELEQCRHILAVRAFMNIEQTSSDTKELLDSQKGPPRIPPTLWGWNYKSNGNTIYNQLTSCTI